MRPASRPAARPAPTADMTAAATVDDIECTRRRTLGGIERCLALLAGAIARDWRHCGKAACARSRRCRGFACEVEGEA